MTRFDVAVVGAGPAGLSAALNAAVRRQQVIVIGPEDSEKLLQTQHLENVLGMPGETGPGLMKRFREHVNLYEQVTFDASNVQVVYDMGGYLGLLMPGNRIIEAWSVVLATGVNFGTPLPGENEFLGRGVGYCATCDAALYRGRSVIVVGYNNEAVEEANFIAEMASTTLFVNRTGRPVQLNSGIQVRDDRPLEVIGSDHAEGLRFETGDVMADGVFLIRDARAADQLAPGIALHGRHVAVDAEMATNLPGVFAAGDLVGQPYQINVAVGRGQIAGLSAAKYATRARLLQETGR